MRLLSNLAEEYAEWRRSLNFSAGTLRLQGRSIDTFIQWLEVTHKVRTSEQLTGRHLIEWQKHIARQKNGKGQPLKPGTVNNKIVAVSGYLNHLVSLGHVPRQLLKALRYVKAPKRLPGNVLSHEEVKQLLESIPAGTPRGFRDRAMMELLYSTGIRVGELLGVNVGDVDFRNATMMVTGKGDKQRVVPIGATALRFLESYVRAVRPFLVKDPAEDALFLNFKGKRVPHRSFLGTVHSLAERAGLKGKVTPHTFRRSCTTELIRGGANMFHVKDLLGHESLDTIQSYAKLTILDLKKTVQRCHPREREDRGDTVSGPQNG